MVSALHRGNSIAVILPCHNEAPAIAGVIAEFRRTLPGAGIHVFDNASTDETAAIARAAGAEVVHVGDKGKGHVVRRMFADVEADIYVMADGDGTYDAAASRALVDALIDRRVDMVVGTRVSPHPGAAYRFGHRFGNRLLTGTVQRMFESGFTDMLSGYRVFSRRFVKSFPALSRGFEIETELTIHAAMLRAPFLEIPTTYGARLEGSESKLDTWRDGFGILKSILRLHMREKPREFYLTLALGGAIASLIFGLPVVFDYVETGLVPRLPTAVAAAAIMIGALLSAACAVLLDSVVTARAEAKRLTYLSVPGVREH